MYEIHRRTLNGKLIFIIEFETVEDIVTGIWKGDSITTHFGYSDIDRKVGSGTMFGEQPYEAFDNCWDHRGTTYKYIVTKNGKLITPDHLLGVWRECKWQEYLARKYRSEVRYNKRRQGRKPGVWGGYRRLSTTQERRMSFDDVEEFTPKVRARRNAANLYDSWDDIRSFPTKSWKDQSKREHQWKHKKGE